MRVSAATLAGVLSAARRTKEGGWFRWAKAPVPGLLGTTTTWRRDQPLVGNLTPLDSSEVPTDVNVGKRRTFMFAWTTNVRLDLKDAIGKAEGARYEVVALLESPSGGQAVRRAVVAEWDDRGGE